MGAFPRCQSCHADGDAGDRPPGGKHELPADRHRAPELDPHAPAAPDLRAQPLRRHARDPEPRRGAARRVAGDVTHPDLDRDLPGAAAIEPRAERAVPPPRRQRPERLARAVTDEDLARGEARPAYKRAFDAQLAVNTGNPPPG